MAEIDLISFKLQAQAEDIKELKRKISNLEAEEARMKIEIEVREKRKLLTGISVLGSIVLALASLIWAFRGDILK